MKKTFVLAATIAAMSIAGVVTAGQPGPEVKSAYEKVMNMIETRLMIISETAGIRAENDTKDIVKKLEAVDELLAKSLAKYTTESAIKSHQERMADLARLASEGSAKGSLSVLRSGLQVYYGDMEGKFPKDLKELQPKYLQKIPSFKVSDHVRNSEVIIVEGAKGDKIDPYIKDTGKWLYISSPDNPKLDGTIVIDCSHKDSKGTVWYTY
jgi:hypothetical protein